MPCLQPVRIGRYGPPVGEPHTVDLLQIPLERTYVLLTRGPLVSLEMVHEPPLEIYVELRFLSARFHGNYPDGICGWVPPDVGPINYETP